MIGEWKNPKKDGVIASIKFDQNSLMTLVAQPPEDENLRTLRKCLTELTPPMLTGKRRRLHHNFNFGNFSMSINLIEGEWDTVLDHLQANKLLTANEAEQVYRNVPFYTNNSFFNDIPLLRDGLDQTCVIPERVSRAFQKITYRKAIDRMTIYLRRDILNEENREILKSHIGKIRGLGRIEFDSYSNAFVVLPGHFDRAKFVMQAISCTPVSPHPHLLPIAFAHYINRVMDFERDLGPSNNEGGDKDKLKADSPQKPADAPPLHFTARAGGGDKGFTR